VRTVAAILALGAAVVALALALPHSGTARRQAPALPTHVLQGRPTTLASLRGRPALVNFFASWCTPCVREAPAFQRAYAQLAGRAGVVAVDWNDGRDSALKFLRRFHWTLPVLEDPNGLVGDGYGIVGLPATFVLDARGRILKRLTGPQTTATLLAAVRA
jgi:thiol-disulfide isomerase/thioredoxin